jgi:hypothetical protein
MVAIADKINNSGGTSKMKQEENHQTARIIQWLGGERAGMFKKKKNMYIYIYIYFIHFS